jgi:hypothetical protein
MPGSHLVHLLHWLHEETEHGGPLAIAGIIVGFVIGYAAEPLWQPTDACLSRGIGKDLLGQCPDVFNGEALLVVLAAGAACGAVGALIGWLVAQGRQTA